MMFEKLGPKDPVFEELCRQAGKEPDDVAAVIVFGLKKRTYILSKGESRVLSLMLAMGVTVEGVTYPPTTTLWQKYEDSDRSFVTGIMRRDPDDEKWYEKWNFAVHDGKPFLVDGKLVIVYTEKTRSA